jgi:2-dehydropantoate 2-reductase
VGPARQARPNLLDGLVEETTAAAATDGVAIDPAAVRERLHSLPGRNAIVHAQGRTGGAVLELDSIAGPILRAAPDGAPVTRGVVADSSSA